VRIAGPVGMSLGVLANHAGCAFVEAGEEADWLYLGLKGARGPDILLLRSGRAPEMVLIEEAGDFLTRRRKDKLSAALLRAAPARQNDLDNVDLRRRFCRIGRICPLCWLMPASIDPSHR
jgi:hypothetical protein